MDRAIFGIGFAWMIVFGSFGTTDSTWKRYAIEMPTFAEESHFDLIGGWSW